MKAKTTLLFINLSVIVFIGALLIPMVCALSFVEDSVKIFSNLGDEGETQDIKKDIDLNTPTVIAFYKYEERLIKAETTFGFFSLGTAPYVKIVIPPHDQT